MSFSGRTAVINEDVRASSTGAKFQESDGPTIGMEISAAQELSISDKLKIWQSKMAQNKVFGTGTVNFPVAKQNCKRLHRKFGLPDDLEQVMSMVAFEGSALEIAKLLSRG